jgi:hypothetical protein
MSCQQAREKKVRNVDQLDAFAPAPLLRDDHDHLDPQLAVIDVRCHHI